MKRRFAHLDVRRKLRLVNTVTLSAAFLAATLVLILHLWSSERDELLRNSEILAEVMVQNCLPAVQFNDAASANEVMGALQRNADVVSATLRLANGEAFASYRRSSGGALPAPPGDDEIRSGSADLAAEFHASHLDLRLPMRDGLDIVGHFEMQVDLSPTVRRMTSSLTLLLFASLLVAGLALFMLDRLQQAIVEPLDHMLDTMRRISASGDYTQRSQVSPGDEFGALSDGFNHMIAQIEERDRHLEHELGERRHAEEMLRRADVRLRLALANAGAGSYEWHPNTGISFWSDELWQLIGLDKNAHTASYETWLAIVHPAEREWVGRVVLEAASSGTEYEIEWRRNVPANQPEQWILERASPLRDVSGRVVRYLGVCFDITERKRIERSLEEYRNRLEEKVAERTSQLSAAEQEQRRLNRALRLLNDCNLALVHAQDESALLSEICRLVVDTGGYLMSWVGVPHPDNRQALRCLTLFRRRETTGRPMAIREAASSLADHTDKERRRQQFGVSLPLRIAQQTIGVLTVYAAATEAFNLDEVRLLEELATNLAFGMHSLRVRREVESYRQRLEDLVEERTGEIALLNEQLAARARDAESANSAKSSFLATMSHEIRTPLNAVLGLTSLLVATPLDRRQRDYADKIELSAQALRALIDDILDFSKIEAGALHLETVPFSLNNILRTLAAVMSVGVKDKPVEALFDIGEGIPDDLQGDTLRLQQILLNLTSNAIKFTAEGTILLSVRRLPDADERIWLEFAVSDTGIGIPPEQQGRIFEVFAQADSSTSRQYGGTGLGLAISTRLADLMGGKLHLESSSGQGSTFRFTVPLALAAGAPSTPQPLLHDGERRRLLIVDDHPEARRLLAKACGDFGWQAETAASAEEGLLSLQAALAEGDDFDLMLLDWQMPGMDGIAMLRQAYATPGIGLPLVVLMAPAWALERAVAASDDLYLDGVLAKPVTPSSLFEAVERAYAGDLGELLPAPVRNDRRLAGMRLLVAEDNELNRQVMQQILTLAGADVVMVNDGQAAAEVLSDPDKRFDAVLMDIQMPVLDGYGATRLIRKELGRTELPIIAVTAYAQPEDYQQARRAGMAGMVLKPINVDELLDLLSREKRPPPLPAIVADSAPRLELPGLQPDALQAFNGDIATYSDLLRQFAERHSGDLAAIRSLTREGDAIAAARRVHDLAGMAAFLRASTLSQLAVTAEQALRKGPPEAIEPALDALHESLLTLLESIDRFPGHLAELSPSQPA